jgi:hypothetical protein
LLLFTPTALLHGAEPAWRSAAQFAPNEEPVLDEAQRALAIQDALLALRKHPEDAAPNFFLGETFFQIGNLHAARHHLDAFLASNPSGPDSTRAAYLGARILLANGMRLRATQQLRRLAANRTAPGSVAFVALLRRTGWNRCDMAEMQAAERAADAGRICEAFHQWKEPVGSKAVALEALAESGAATAELLQLASCGRLGRLERAGLDYVSAGAESIAPEAPQPLAPELETGKSIRHLPPRAVSGSVRHSDPAYFELAFFHRDGARWRPSTCSSV